MEQQRGGILSLLKKCIKGKKEEEEEEEVSEWFIKYGSELLEEIISISSSNGNYGIPIRNFSATDIRRATNGFHQDCLLRGHEYAELFKGSLDGRLILVRKPYYNSQAIRDIAVAAHMSLHMNVLKLIGWCCLEQGDLVAVCEHHGGRLLSTLIDYKGHEPFSWKCRMRIAYEIAYVITYLHTALHRPIVHRDIKPSVFLVDEDGGVKLFDFSLSISIPLGESHVEDRPRGTPGHIDPEYVRTSFVTDKCDVYSFGMLLLQLLTGKHLSMGNTFRNLRDMVESGGKNGQLTELVDPRTLEEGEGVQLQQQQILAIAELILRCIQKKGVDRPDMIEVAKELRQIHKSAQTSTIGSTSLQARTSLGFVEN